MPPMKLKRNKKTGKWWIRNVWDGEQFVKCGPYNTVTEAKEDMEGLERTEEHGNDPKFFTTDPPKKRRKSQ